MDGEQDQEEKTTNTAMGEFGKALKYIGISMGTFAALVLLAIVAYFFGPTLLGMQ